MFRLLFIALSLELLPSLVLLPPLPRKPLKNDFLEIPLAIEFITPRLPLPSLFSKVESFEFARICVLAGGNVILELPWEEGKLLDAVYAELILYYEVFYQYYIFESLNILNRYILNKLKRLNNL